LSFGLFDDEKHKLICCSDLERFAKVNVRVAAYTCKVKDLDIGTKKPYASFIQIVKSFELNTILRHPQCSIIWFWYPFQHVF